MQQPSVLKRGTETLSGEFCYPRRCLDGLPALLGKALMLVGDVCPPWSMLLLLYAALQTIAGISIGGK